MVDCVENLYANKDLSLLKKLTLVIPTYNRNFYLSRCLWYHAHFPFAEIIVADSSHEGKKLVNGDTVQKICEKFDINIRYLKYNPECEKYGGDIYRKWNDAIQRVETEYSVICTDKEFLIPTTTCKCIAFLDKHYDYSNAEGQVYKIREYPKNTLQVFPWQNVSSVISESRVDRLKSACVRTTGTLFSVYRANVQKEIYNNLRKYDIDDIRFGETALELQPLIYGKIHKYDKVPGKCRDIWHLKNTTVIISKLQKSESSFTRYPLYEDYPLNISQKLLQNITSCLYEYIIGREKHSGITKDEIKQIILLIMKKRYGVTNTKYGIYYRFKSIRKIWDTLPLSLQYIILGFLREQHMELPLSKTLPEIQCIGNVVLFYDKYYNTDTAIF